MQVVAQQVKLIIVPMVIIFMFIINSLFNQTKNTFTEGSLSTVMYSVNNITYLLSDCYE